MKNTVLTAVLALLAATSSQASVNIEYTTGGTSVTSGLGNDTLTLNPFSGGSVDLTPNGSPAFGLLNIFKLDAINSPGGFIDTTSFSQTLTATFDITLPLGSQTLIQTATQVHLTIPFTGGDQLQTLFISTGTPVDFDWSSGGSDYDLTVTPLGAVLGPVLSTRRGVTYTGAIFGEFDLTATSAVPEPATCVAGALLLLPLGLSALRACHKKRAA